MSAPRCFVTEVSSMGDVGDRDTFFYAVVVLDDGGDVLKARRRHLQRIVAKSDDALDEMSFTDVSARFYAEPPAGLTAEQQEELDNNHWTEIPYDQPIEPGDEHRTALDRVVVTAYDVTWRSLGKYCENYYETHRLRFEDLFPSRKKGG